ncbi:MAG: hypothetical protein GY855_11890, partial [candidate division Zixibacteria bacterium]|nr:hypothetical protein [candidate division Zixibacteria bacterium]
MRVKFIVILIGGLLLLMNAYGMCYTNNSFRNQSTAFTLDDDLDEWIADYSLNMTNPSGLFKFDGYRLYTNLSNLVNKNEGQFSNSSLDNFLVGGSGDFYRGYRFGSIVNRERYENDYEYSSDHSEFTDNDNNGTFDSRERYISETGTDTTDVSTEFIFALAGQKAKLDYGISFELYNNKCVSDRVTNYDTSSMDLVTGQLNRIASDDLNWGYDCKTNITAITLGGLYHKSQRLNIGGRIGISMEGYEANDNRLELCSTDRSPADADLLDQTYTKD